MNKYLLTIAGIMSSIVTFAQHHNQEEEMKNEIQDRINRVYDRSAQHYEEEESHKMQAREREFWVNEVFRPYIKGSKVLDVGSGTGILTEEIANYNRSLEVTGLEPSKEMLLKASQKPGRVENIKFVLGDSHSGGIFEKEVFHAILSRQVVCHFHDPLLAFQNWYQWLQKDGIVVVVDGFWSRDAWSDGGLADRLPLGSIQTSATTGYLLTLAGFRVLESRYREDLKRYVVIAQKK